MQLQEKKFKFIIEGGQATAGPPIGPSLSPLGLNVLQVVEEINAKTAEFRGMRVPVELYVDTDTKQFRVEVGTPSMAALIAKESGIEKGSGAPGNDFVGNLSFDTVVKIARLKMPSLRVNSLKSAVKTVVGTCVSMGVRVDGRDPRSVLKDIDNGLYDEQLKE